MTNPLDRIHQRLLVLRCQTADPRAFEELIALYQPRLRRFVGTMLQHDPHIIDDALQDIWLDVWRSIGRLKDADALPAWLFRIARDRAYRILRRRHVPVSHTLDEIEPPAGDADVLLDADERQLIARSIQSLGHEHREVLLLRFVEDLSYEQIALAVGCELGTVRSRLFYAKQALRQLIERNGP